MGKIACFFCLLVSLKINAQNDTTRVLFIGNSFTYVNNMPDLVQGLADAAHLPFKFVMYAPGGISVGDTAQGTSAHMNNPIVFNLIRSDNWDFVCLQDNQGRFIYGNCHFPDTNVSKVVRGHLKIRDSVEMNHPCAHMLWFAGWGPKNGYPGYASTGSGLIDNIYDDYMCMNNTANEIISPIGKAWERELTILPLVDLWGSDLTHPSLEGAYLTASVIFTSIFRINTEKVQFYGGIDTVTATTLRRIAYQTVMDSIVTTNLSHFLPDITVNSGSLSASTGYINYRWYQNDTLIDSSGVNTVSVATNGCYYVIATDSNGCSSRSVEKCTFPENIGSLTLFDTINIFPIPADNLINIDMKRKVSGKIQLTDETGRIINEFEIPSNHFQIPIQEIPVGVYFITIRTSEGNFHQKITKL